jgi:hypothetical protein
MPEWTNGAALKAARPLAGLLGSNPSPPAPLSSRPMGWETGEGRSARHQRGRRNWPAVVAAALVLIPWVALAVVVLLELEAVPALLFFAICAGAEVLAGVLAVWGIARASSEGRLLWIAVLSAVLALPGAMFFALGAAFNVGT